MQFYSVFVNWVLIGWSIQTCLLSKQCIWNKTSENTKLILDINLSTQPMYFDFTTSENTKYMSKNCTCLLSSHWWTSCFWYLHKCDPAPLNEVLWGEYQNSEKYFIARNTIFYTFWSCWCKYYYSMIFPSKEFGNVERHKCDIIQNNFTEIWAVKDCSLCVLLWVNQVEYV